MDAPGIGRAMVLEPGEPAPRALELCHWAELDLGRPLDAHLHTDFTDGRASPELMLAAARRAGLARVLISEHVRHDSTYFPDLVARVRALPPEGLTVYVGVECKILDLGGRLDCPPWIAQQAQAIVASVHSPPGGGGMAAWRGMGPAQALELELALALAAVRHGRAHILGHPLGMVIKLFGLKPLDELRQLARACRRHGKALELNARYCPDPRAWLEIVQSEGCLVSLGSDAHGPEEVGLAWRIFARGER